MSSTQIRSWLDRLKAKYIILVIPAAVFFLLSGVFTGYAAPARSDQAKFSKVRPPASAGEKPGVASTSLPDQVFPKALSTPTPEAVVGQATPPEPTFFVFLPTILKAPPYRFTPQGVLILAAHILDLPLNNNSADLTAAQVQPTAPNPTLPPGVTLVPTAGPGSPTHTPTPKASVTPTATATPPPILIPNGDFEDTSNNEAIGWKEFSLKDYPIVFDEDSEALPELPVSAFDDHAVWLGGDEDELSLIQRDIFIRADRPFLGHKFYLYSVDPVCASELFSDLTVEEQFIRADATSLNNLQSDVGGLIVYQNGAVLAGYALDLCAAKARAWSEIIYSPRLDFLRGVNPNQPVTIQFKMINDSQLTSSFFIDDVSYYAGIPLNFTPFGNSGSQLIHLQEEGERPSLAVPYRLVPDKRLEMVDPQTIIRKNR